jgi:hypothetical protein
MVVLKPSSAPLKPPPRALGSTAIQPSASGTTTCGGGAPHGVPGGSTGVGVGSGVAPLPAIMTVWKVSSSPVPLTSQKIVRLPTMTGQSRLPVRAVRLPPRS